MSHDRKLCAIICESSLIKCWRLHQQCFTTWLLYEEEVVCHMTGSCRLQMFGGKSSLIPMEILCRKYIKKFLIVLDGVIS